VLRQHRHVRAGRRGELGVDHLDGGRLDGPAAAAEQPDGPAARRQTGHPAAGALGRPGHRRTSATRSTTSARCWRCGPTAWSSRSPRPPAPSWARRDRAAGRHPSAPRHRAGVLRRAPPAGAPSYSSTSPTCSTPRTTRAGWRCSPTDIRYLMPVRVTTARGTGFDTSPGHGALRRGQILADGGWPGSPPSTPGPRTHRRGCATTWTNVRCFAGPAPTSWSSSRPVLLFRSRVTCGSRRWSRPTGRTCCGATRAAPPTSAGHWMLAGAPSP